MHGAAARRKAATRLGAAWRVAPTARLALTTLLVCAGYYAGGAFALTVRFPPSGISFVWPSNAILLAALLLTPPRTWWLYLLAVLPTHLNLAAHYHPGVP